MITRGPLRFRTHNMSERFGHRPEMHRGAAVISQVFRRIERAEQTICTLANAIDNGSITFEKTVDVLDRVVVLLERVLAK